MPVPEYARQYLLNAISATPLILRTIVADLPAEMWDRAPDPDRFTLREMAAHLADWEPIWLERFERMRNEPEPFLPNVDESEIAVEHRYGELDWSESLKRFEEGRKRLVSLLGEVREEEWDRLGNRERAGIVSLYQLAVIVLSHDGYHLKQAAEYVQQAPKNDL